MSKQTSDMIELDNKLGAIIASDETREFALNGDDPILCTAARLVNNVHPTLPSLTHQAIRNMLLEELLKSSKTKPPLRGDFLGWMGRVAAVLVLAIMFAFVAQPISASSLPDDILYPVKLGFEKIELVLARSSSARVQIHLNHAQERIQEAQALSSDSTFILSTLESAVDSFNQATAIGTENAIFENDSRLAEETLTIFMTLEQSLYLNDRQILLETIQSNMLIAPASSVEITPEATQTNIDVMPEVTETVIIESGQWILYIHAESRVNIRSGAGTEFSIVGTANQNAPVIVITQNSAGDWLEIQLPNGLQGWVSIDFLDDRAGQSSPVNNDNNSNGNANGNSNGNNANGNANGNSNGNNANGNANGNSSN